jgi:hypothetical protein
MASKPRFEMFNAKAEFCMPSAEAIAELSPESRAHFESVKAAHVEYVAADAAAVAAVKSVPACVIALEVAETQRREAFPKQTPVEAARAWIASQNAQRY